MKLVKEHINEANFKDILKPLSRKEVLDRIKHMSQEEKDEKLVNAVQDGNLKITELLLKAGADIKVKNRYGDTLLSIAYIF